MNEIVKKIFKESSHEENTTEGGITYFSYKDVTYYFLLELEQMEFEGIRKFADLEDNVKYKKLKSNFDNHVAQGKSNTMEKNSSLIVIIKCDSLQGIETYQQQIFLLEEDEYFFKKYVVIYSEESIKDFKQVEHILPSLQEKVNQEDKFEAYRNKGYQVELEEYLITLQLFIKLPFLKMVFTGDIFKSLESKIAEELGEDLVNLYDQFMERFDDISSLQFENEKSTDSIEEILTILPND
jgi:ABC-3C biological conflict system middle component